MLEKLKGNAKMFNGICAVLMAVLLVLQFVPFWHFADGEEQAAVSISSYIWFPADNDGVDDYLSAAIEDHSINDMLVTPILLLVLCAVGVVFCLIKSRNPFALLLPLASGFVGTVGYLTTPALQMGGAWVLHLLVSILLLAAAAAGFVLHWKDSRAS